MAKHGIRTALAFSTLPERWILQHLPKLYYEIRQELRDTSVLALETQAKEDFWWFTQPWGCVPEYQVRGQPRMTAPPVRRLDAV